MQYPSIHRLSQSITLLLVSLLIAPVSAWSKNGFDLSNALINVNKILSGGPSKDGIPAIDNPRFTPGNNAEFLTTEDRILGIELNGRAKAYPIKILNWHEIVNDKIGGNNFTVTYCPLCGTGVAFSAEVNGKMLNFGVSGLLYNSDVLLYDRDTQSLWSQIMGQAVSGQLVGQKLTAIALSHTTWHAWLQQHPDSLVLNTDTGFHRNYDRNPYAGYEKSRDIYFKTSHKAPDYYHPKERVLGLESGGSFKAYPFIELNKQGQTRFKDSFDGQRFTIEWDDKNQSGNIYAANGKMIPAIQGYWFAWFAFHPNTEVFKAN
jgi:Protein of unknown function (DUF3179)